jgi:hypothetical protein
MIFSSKINLAKHLRTGQEIPKFWHQRLSNTNDLRITEMYFFFKYLHFDANQPMKFASFNLAP